MHLVPKARQHAANLPVFPFVEHHFENGTLLVLGAEVDMLGPRHTLGEADPAAEFVERFGGRHSRHLDKVFLFDSIPGVGEEVGQFAVVGDQDQSLAHPIEATDGEQPLFTRHEVDDAWATIGVEIGSHHAHRLGKHVDHPLGVGEPFTVDADFLPLRIDPGAELGEHLPIHFNPSFGDQFLALPSAAQPCRGQHLLQPLQSVVKRGGQFGGGGSAATRRGIAGGASRSLTTGGDA